MQNLHLQNILVTAYSPLGTPDSPEAGFKENVQAKKPMDDPLINKIAKDLGKTPAQVGFFVASSAPPFINPQTVPLACE